jgi:putative ABC transport system permease protein
MELRLLAASLVRRRRLVALAVLAITIGASVASAMLHVSADVSRKLSRELRALGPNLLVLPAEGAGAAGRQTAGALWLDAGAALARLHEAGVDGAPLLYAVGRVRGEAVQLVGADLAAARRLHPSWRVGPGPGTTLMGVRLMARLGVATGDRLRIELGSRTTELVVGAGLTAGGPDDQAWWIPLAEAQTLADLPGGASLIQARLPATADPGPPVRAIERDGRWRATPLHALTATEAGLLERMRRLMALVTIAALVAAGLCAFGSLTDLALERRRDIALMKALGATRRHVARLMVAEAAAIGLLGGVLGWLLGAGFAQVIGRRVFTSPIALRADVPFQVIALGLAISVLAVLWPMRLALAVQPATALKGD